MSDGTRKQYIEFYNAAITLRLQGLSIAEFPITTEIKLNATQEIVKRFDVRGTNFMLFRKGFYTVLPYGGGTIAAADIVKFAEQHHRSPLCHPVDDTVDAVKHTWYNTTEAAFLGYFPDGVESPEAYHFVRLAFAGEAHRMDLLDLPRFTLGCLTVAAAKKYFLNEKAGVVVIKGGFPTAVQLRDTATLRDRKLLNQYLASQLVGPTIEYIQGNKEYNYMFVSAQSTQWKLSEILIRALLQRATFLSGRCLRFTSVKRRMHFGMQCFTLQIPMQV